jgi:hypothetical protein
MGPIRCLSFSFSQSQSHFIPFEIDFLVAQAWQKHMNKRKESPGNAPEREAARPCS